MGAIGTGVTPARMPETPIQNNTLLLAGGYFSLAFAVFQISGIFWPPRAIKYFGGPVELSQTRPVSYALLCIFVGLVVAVFGLYALSGAGKIAGLRFLRAVITAATVIYLLRGLLLFAQLPFVIQHPSLWRFALFSLISLGVGLVHLGGLIKLLKHGRVGE